MPHIITPLCRPALSLSLTGSRRAPLYAAWPRYCLLITVVQPCSRRECGNSGKDAWAAAVGAIAAAVSPSAPVAAARTTESRVASAAVIPRGVVVWLSVSVPLILRPAALISQLFLFVFMTESPKTSQSHSRPTTVRRRRTADVTNSSEQTINGFELKLSQKQEVS